MLTKKFQRHETRDICHSFLDAERTTEEKRIGAHLRTHYDRRAPARGLHSVRQQSRNVEPAQGARDGNEQAGHSGQRATERFPRQNHRHPHQAAGRGLCGQCGADQAALPQPDLQHDDAHRRPRRLREAAAGRGGRAHHAAHGRQVRTAAALPETVPRPARQGRGHSRRADELRVSGRLQPLPANRPPLPPQRGGRRDGLSAQLCPLLPAQRVDYEKPVPLLQTQRGRGAGQRAPHGA